MRSINVKNYNLPEGKMWVYARSETEFHDDYGNHYKIAEDDGDTVKLEHKLNWLKTATDDQLLNQYSYLTHYNEYGCNDGDIQLTRGEILARMRKGA